MEDAGLEGNLRRGLWTKACRAIVSSVSDVLLPAVSLANHIWIAFLFCTRARSVWRTIRGPRKRLANVSHLG